MGRHQHGEHTNKTHSQVLTNNACSSVHLHTHAAFTNPQAAQQERRVSVTYGDHYSARNEDDPASSSRPGTCNKAVTHRHPHEEPKEPLGDCIALPLAFPRLQQSHLPLVPSLGSKVWAL